MVLSSSHTEDDMTTHTKTFTIAHTDKDRLNFLRGEAILMGKDEADVRARFEAANPTRKIEFVRGWN